MENIYSQGTAQWRKWLTFWVNKLKADGETFETDLTAVNLEITNLQNEKQNTLVSGQNIKTINGNDITGAGDVVIASTGPAVVQNTGTSETDVMSQKAVSDELALAYAAANNANTIANSKPTIFEGYANLPAGVETLISGTSFTPVLNLRPVNIQVFYDGMLKNVMGRYVTNGDNYDVYLTSDVDLFGVEITLLGTLLNYLMDSEGNKLFSEDDQVLMVKK